MVHELLSLNVMLVGMPGSEAELWRQGAGAASIPVNIVVQDAASAAAALDGTDICVLDDALPDDVSTQLLAAAKSLKAVPNFFLRSVRGTARPTGFTGVLAKPHDVAEAQKIMETCIRIRMPTRVLIVDDSSTMRSIVRKILSASRFRLELDDAAEGLVALERLRQQQFGLVFLDYNMPGFDGFETLSEIKRVSPKVAVVMMTTTVDEQVASRAAALGAHGFLRKPFYPADIDRVLDRYYGLVS